ncbi:MAG TPA: trehalose-phosphatase, partial [bacterium]|nr:trehalose-phosphatase [bacterium]
LELRPTGWDKGRALRRLLARRAPGWKKTGACLYAGDDATDEDAFQALRGMGPMAFGLKIGPGRSRAHGRVPGPAQYWSLLERVLRLRAAA